MNHCVFVSLKLALYLQSKVIGPLRQSHHEAPLQLHRMDEPLEGGPSMFHIYTSSSINLEKALKGK